MLTVYIDLKSPYAFVALKPTLALEAELGAAFDWRPLTLDIPSFLGSAEKRQGQVVRSEGRSPNTWRFIHYAYMDARRYAQRQGLILKGTEKIWDSSLAGIALLWVNLHARHRLAHYLVSVFTPFWQRELNIEDIAVLEACLQSAGVPHEGFRNFVEGPGRVQHDALMTQARDDGIFGVPTYVLDDQLYFGREHLPYLRWRLTGQRGPAPDIAYDPDGNVPC